MISPLYQTLKEKNMKILKTCTYVRKKLRWIIIFCNSSNLFLHTTMNWLCSLYKFIWLFLWSNNLYKIKLTLITLKLPWNQFIFLCFLLFYHQFMYYSVFPCPIAINFMVLTMPTSYTLATPDNFKLFEQTMLIFFL